MSAGIPTLDLPGQKGPMNGNASVHKMPSSSIIGMEDDEGIAFGSPEEETRYYRDKYRRALDLLEETRNELDDFQSSSKELEDELERELAATEKQQAELKDRIKRLEVEKDEWKAKHVALQKMHSSTVGAMQREMDNLKSERDRTLVALRDLEMGNDELERNERVAVSSLLDLESKYNRAIEEKTLLEQEVIQRQEIEEECQRLKDDIRDANNEIAILRDQVTRSIPTPPSSVSVHMSPLAEATHEETLPEIPSLISEKPATPEPPRKTQVGMVRSNTVSSIPTLSPSTKRFSSTYLNSPSAIARSTTSRNLAAAATPSSPALARSRSGLPQPSPARQATLSSNLAAKTKGVKLLRELQARLKATDDKLGTKVPKRNVSNPMVLTGRHSAPRSPLQEPATVTPVSHPSDQTNAMFLSPNGWILVDDETPPHQMTSSRFGNPPDSPIETMHFNQQQQQHRAVSAASSSSSSRLPSRPGIPSSLANLHTSQLSKSTSSRQLPKTRPMSPSSLLPQPTRIGRRAPSPAFQTLSAAGRPSSRQDRPLTSINAIGRGPPPVAGAGAKFPTHHPLSMSISQSPGGPRPETPGALRRSTRRSSLGGAEAHLPPTSIPAPSPGRPVSVPVFGMGEAPPVPRIPSSVMRESTKRREAMAQGRPQSMFDR